MKNEVYLYIANFKAIKEEYFLEMAGDLNFEQKLELDLIVDENTRKQKIVLYSIFNELKIWDELSYDKGKPILQSGYISISHSGSCVAVTICDNFPIGIDIQKIDKKVLWEPIASKLSNNISCNNIKDFYSLWTISESIIKVDEEIGFAEIKNLVHIEDNLYGVFKKNFYVYSFELSDMFIAICCTNQIDTIIEN